jgi:hypothetical protein
MLDHGADAVDTGRREAIAENEDVVAQSAEQGKTHNEQVSYTFFRKFHGSPLLSPKIAETWPDLQASVTFQYIIFNSFGQDRFLSKSVAFPGAFLCAKCL